MKFIIFEGFESGIFFENEKNNTHVQSTGPGRVCLSCLAMIITLVVLVIS